MDVIRAIRKKGHNVIMKQLIPIAVCASLAFVATDAAHAKSTKANANATHGQGQGNGPTNGNPPNPSNTWKNRAPGWDSGKKIGWQEAGSWGGYKYPPGIIKNIKKGKKCAPYREDHPRFQDCPASP